MGRLTWQHQRYEWHGTFAERGLAAAAGLRPDASSRPVVWYTTEAVHALALAEYAAWEAALRLREFSAAVAASAVTATTFRPQCPVGQEPRPFQCAGVEWLLNHPRALLAESMGCGKTIQAILAINHLPEVKRVLVLCPASVKLNWENEFRAWLTRPLTVGVAAGNFCPATDIVIANYDIVGRVKPRLAALDLLILDECQYIKNPRAVRTAEVVGRESRFRPVLPIRAARVIALSGTPMENRPAELWTLLHYLDPVAWPNANAFYSRYCAATWGPHGFDCTGASNLDELRLRLRSTLMLRRLKADVLPELPPKQRQIIELGVGADKLLTDLKSRLSADFVNSVEGLRVARRLVADAIATVRKESGLAKFDAALAHLKDQTADGHKLVVFGWTTELLQRLHREFPGSVLVTGATPVPERQAAVERFTTATDCQVFFGNIRAAGVGINLQVASHVVFVEFDWTPGTMEQAADRCHRLGQRDSVLVQYLVLRGTLDAVVAKTFVRKAGLVGQALDGLAEAVALDLGVDL